MIQPSGAHGHFHMQTGLPVHTHAHARTRTSTRTHCPGRVQPLAVRPVRRTPAYTHRAARLVRWHRGCGGGWGMWGDEVGHMGVPGDAGGHSRVQRGAGWVLRSPVRIPSAGGRGTFPVTVVWPGTFPSYPVMPWWLLVPEFLSQLEVVAPRPCWSSARGKL